MGCRRHYQPGAEGDRVLDVPPLGMSALTWGLFMGASSNLRYQAVFGLERVVDKTIARRVPQARPLRMHRCSCVMNLGLRRIDVITTVANYPQPSRNLFSSAQQCLLCLRIPLHQFQRQNFHMSVEHSRTCSVWQERSRSN